MGDVGRLALFPRLDPEPLLGIDDGDRRDIGRVGEDGLVGQGWSFALRIRCATDVGRGGRKVTHAYARARGGR
mgnify:CR=1 FL=1